MVAWRWGMMILNNVPVPGNSSSSLKRSLGICITFKEKIKVVDRHRHSLVKNSSYSQNKARKVKACFTFARCLKEGKGIGWSRTIPTVPLTPESRQRISRVERKNGFMLTPHMQAVLLGPPASAHPVQVSNAPHPRAFEWDFWDPWPPEQKKTLYLKGQIIFSSQTLGPHWIDNVQCPPHLFLLLSHQAHKAKYDSTKKLVRWESHTWLPFSPVLNHNLCFQVPHEGTC